MSAACPLTNGVGADDFECPAWRCQSPERPSSTTAAGSDFFISGDKLDVAALTINAGTGLDTVEILSPIQSSQCHHQFRPARSISISSNSYLQTGNLSITNTDGLDQFEVTDASFSVSGTVTVNNGAGGSQNDLTADSVHRQRSSL